MWQGVKMDKANLGGEICAMPLLCKITFNGGFQKQHLYALVSQQIFFFPITKCFIHKEENEYATKKLDL